MGIGHRVFDTVCQVGGECGFPSKLTGAGGGGCAFCLIVPGWCTVSASLACVHACTMHDHCDGQVWHVHLLCVSSMCSASRSYTCPGLCVTTLSLLSHGAR